VTIFFSGAICFTFAKNEDSAITVIRALVEKVTIADFDRNDTLDSYGVLGRQSGFSHGIFTEH
jgi:hypothetical protein